MADEFTAEVNRVPAPYGGRVLTAQTAVIKNGLFLLQVVLVLASSFVPSLLGVAVGRYAFPNDAQLSFAPILAGLGFTVLLMWLFFGRLLRNPWSSCYVFHKTQREILQRPDPIVDPTNPDAILVEVIPRRNWGQLTLENAEDQGFLFVDADRRQLFFEGDKQRYRIPVQAVLSCEVEMMNKNTASDERSIPVALVILKIRDARVGEREIPLLPRRTVAGDTLGGNYVDRARELHHRIQSVTEDEPVIASTTAIP